MTPEERRHLSEEIAPIPLPYQFSGDGYERKRGDGTPDRGYNLWSGNLETGENLRMVGTVQIPKGENWGHRETLATILFISRATRAFHDLQAVLQLADTLYKRQHATCQSRQQCGVNFLLSQIKRRQHLKNRRI